jgi:hypothetical protein
MQHYQFFADRLPRLAKQHPLAGERSGKLRSADPTGGEGARIQPCSTSIRKISACPLPVLLSYLALFALSQRPLRTAQRSGLRALCLEGRAFSGRLAPEKNGTIELRGFHSCAVHVVISASAVSVVVRARDCAKQRLIPGRAGGGPLRLPPSPRERAGARSGCDAGGTLSRGAGLSRDISVDLPRGWTLFQARVAEGFWLLPNCAGCKVFG